MPGMLNINTTAAFAPTKVAVPNLDSHRRAAMDAFVQHETLLGDPKGFTARLGPAGYAQALAQAAQQADMAEAVYRQAWTALNGQATGAT